MASLDSERTETADGHEPTQRGRILCAEFLVEMLHIGWKRSDLDFLEALWWKYRDKHGRLSDPKVTPPEAPTDG